MHRGHCEQTLSNARLDFHPCDEECVLVGSQFRLTFQACPPKCGHTSMTAPGESQLLRHTALNVRFRRRDRRFVTTALSGRFWTLLGLPDLLHRSLRL